MFSLTDSLTLRTRRASFGGGKGREGMGMKGEGGGGGDGVVNDGGGGVCFLYLVKGSPSSGIFMRRQLVSFL